MKFPGGKINPKTSILYFTFCFAIFVLISCGNSGGGNGETTDTGSVTFALKFDDRETASTSRAALSPSGDVCADYLISEIAADLYDFSKQVVSSDSWPCSAHKGTLDDVPAGSGLSLSLEVMNDSGNVDWVGEADGITVFRGRSTNVGTVELMYIGDDNEPPKIAITDPPDDTLGVSTNHILKVTFDEDVVGASVENTSVFSLTEDGVGINYSAEYTSSNWTVVFKPDSPLAPDTRYKATLRGTVEDRAGLSMGQEYSWEFVTEKGPDVDPPTNPVLQDVVAVSPNAIDLTWSASTDQVAVDHYRVYRDGKEVQRAKTTSATDQGLASDTEYCYRIQAYDPSGNFSDMSNELCEFTLSDLPPPEPELTSPDSGTELDNGCQNFSDPIEWNFSWSETDDATKYRIYVICIGCSTPLIDSVVTTASYQYQDTGYLSELNWSWRVRAGNDQDDWSNWSETRSFSIEPIDTDCTEPAPPVLNFPNSNATLDNNCDDNSESIDWDFDWSGDSKSTKYQIYIIGPSASNPVVDEEVATSFYHYSSTGWVPDENRLNWTWRVRAGNDLGEWSDWIERSFNVEPVNTDCPGLASPTLISPPPDTLLDNNCDDNSDSIEWDFDWSDVPGATKYEIYVIKSGATVPFVDQEVTTSFYHLSSTGWIEDASRLKWVWRVRAGNDRGDWSDWNARPFDVEPVNTDCPVHEITNIRLSPEPPATLKSGERVNITFAYYTEETDGVRIFVRPYTHGARSPDYAAHPSPLYPPGSKDGSGWFTIDSSHVTVDQLQFRMYNADQSELLLEFYINVSYNFL